MLEDNVWDEFGDTDDHIVPGTRDGCWDQFTVQVDSRKKPRNVVMGVDSSADNVTRYGISGDEKRGLPSLTKDAMLGKSSWSQTTDGAFSTSCDNDPHKESIACDPSPMSSHGLQNGHIDSVGTEFCAGDAILVDKRTAEDNNVYCYPLNHISQTDDDLSFFNNERDDKESNDLLYFGWPDIGNFEDVDRMFRSCDSTFGLGLSSEDELCWLSTSHAAEGSEDALKPDGKLSGQAHHGTSRAENAGLSLDDSKQKSIFNSDKKNTSGNGGDRIHFSNFNPQLAESKSKDELITNDQISLHIKQSKRPGNSVQKEDWRLENGSSFHHYNNIKQLADVKHPHGDSSCEVFSSGFQHHKQNGEPDSTSYMQTGIPCMHLSYGSPSDQISLCPTQSGMNSENNGHPTSTKESSYASNQVQSMESPLGSSFVAPTLITNEKKGKLRPQQDMQASFNRNFRHVNAESQMTFHDPVIFQKQIHQSEQDEGHSEVEGVSVGGVPGELDSSNAQESSCVSSVLDEISLEATSFRQLQQVMEKLDIRTKLCIRDSLYRLARSAEQRHNCDNAKGGFRDDKDPSGLLMAEDTNKCTAFMDMETDTNPIDRSIAHLLFHRPTDPSNDSIRSDAVVHRSITGPPVMAEKHVSKEENGRVSEKEMLTKDSK